MMKRRSHTFFASMILMLVGLCCALLFAGRAQAEEDDDWMHGGPHPPISGNGWAIDKDGIMTVVSDAGWQDFLANGPGEWIWEYEDATVIERVQKLVIGKNVTSLSIYDPTRMNESPMEDVAISFCYGAGVYKPYVSVMFQDPKCMPPEIEVEEGNRVFSVEKGLLINNVKKSVVLSEIDVTDIVIPEGIREIEAWAFYYRNITSVVFPESLKTIGAAAFSKCNNLTEVNLPDTLTRMDACAFAECESLKSVTLSSGLKTIEGIAFRYCPLENITIPEGVETIGFMAFEDCGELAQVTLPDSLTKIDNYAFSTCKNLKEITLPSRLSYIGFRAFEDCESLQVVQMPNSLKTIGEEAYLGCELTMRQLPERLMVNAVPVEERGWYSDFSEEEPSTRQLGCEYVETLIVSGTKYSMGDFLVNQAGQVIFLQKPPADWRKITPQISSNRILYLEQYKASWSTLDQGVWGSVHLIRISESRLNEIRRESVNFIDDSSQPQATDSLAEGERAQDFESSGWSMYGSGTLEIRSNDGWLNWLRQNQHINPSKLIIGKNVTELTLYDMSETVPAADFYQYDDIIGTAADGSPIYSYAETSFINPIKIVLDAGNQTFSYQYGMLINNETKEVVLSDWSLPDKFMVPEGIRSIGNGAFRSRNFSVILLPKTLERIGVEAFERCKMKRVELPESVTSIGKHAFEKCTLLTTILLPEGLRTIGGGAFRQSGIDMIVLPDRISVIGADTFADCENLKHVQLPKDLTAIGSSAFQNCAQLEYVWFSAGIESIGPSAFSGCTKLREILLPDSLKAIGNDAFQHCAPATLRIPPQLHIYEFDFARQTFTVGEAEEGDTGLGLTSIGTFIVSGSNYDLGELVTNSAENIYFQSAPPENVGDIFPVSGAGNIFCSNSVAQAWTDAEISDWVRSKMVFVPAAQIENMVSVLMSATPKPYTTPQPSPTLHLVRTPGPTATLQPTVTPKVITENKKQTVDPIIVLLIVFILLIIAAVVLLYLKPWVKKKHRRKRRKVSQLPAASPAKIEPIEPENTEKTE